MDRQSGKFYAVSFDTPLGQALQKYFAEADRCDKAALDFVAHLSDHYTFPPTADAEAVQPADAEAGGLVAVRVSVATLPKPDPILWDSLPDPDSPDHILYFPRVTISSHYIRYGVAHFLDVNAAPDWTFRRNPDGTIRYYHLEKVRNLIPPDDFQRLHEQERPNGTIPPSSVPHVACSRVSSSCPLSLPTPSCDFSPCVTTRPVPLLRSSPMQPTPKASATSSTPPSSRPMRHPSPLLSTPRPHHLVLPPMQLSSTRSTPSSTVFSAKKRQPNNICINMRICAIIL